MTGYQDLSEFERGVIVSAREMGHGISEQVSATPHTSRIDTEGLQEHSSEFRHFHWSPKSPDMNIIEYIWDALQHAVQKRSQPHPTPTDLWSALQDSWCQLPPAFLQTFFESMPRGVVALLRARGGPTRY
ncbi:transposable element tcb2 transposase [Trichonephila clavipes]|uniref:Transposable element tcb2 transposase n=1 Tax=Trichonephila clavipes TaxID=2585209 RepID=A0A8X6W3S9_TRICX|nr:transposable element tcb2 transposase [Trichonephila clavipes]